MKYLGGPDFRYMFLYVCFDNLFFITKISFLNNFLRIRQTFEIERITNIIVKGKGKLYTSPI